MAEPKPVYSQNPDGTWSFEIDYNANTGDPKKDGAMNLEYLWSNEDDTKIYDEASSTWHDKTPETTKDDSKSVNGVDLEPYTGWSHDFDIDLTDREKSLMSLVSDLISGKEGTFRTALSGKPDYGQLQNLINIGDTELREKVIPQIKDIYSGGPLGAGVQTGARRAAEENAYYEKYKNDANLRSQAYYDALNRSLTAQGMIPQMAQVLATERMNDVANIERDMAIHYQNQGLSLQEFNADLNLYRTEIEKALGEAQLELKQQELEMLQEQQKNADKAALWGSLGSLFGAGVGSLFGPGGTMIGSQLGSGLGLSLGGSPSAGYSTLSSVPSSYISLSMLEDVYGQDMFNVPSFMQSRPSIMSESQAVNFY